MEIRNKLTYIDPTKQFRSLNKINKSEMLKKLIKTNDIIGHASDAYVLISRNNERQQELQNSKKYQYIKKENIDVKVEEKDALWMSPLLFINKPKRKPYAIYDTSAINISNKKRKEIRKRFPVYGEQVKKSPRKIRQPSSKSKYAVYKIQNFFKIKKSMIPKLFIKKTKKYATI